MPWSLDEYCQSELLRQRNEDWSLLPESSRHFLQSLQLPTIHPFCQATKLDEFQVEGIPPMGPLLQEDYHHHVGDVIVTHLYRVLPALLAMGELWLRLFASVIAPLGIAYLVYGELLTALQKKSRVDSTIVSNRFCAGIILTVASSVVLLTDTFYVLEYGSHYGLVLFVVSSALALRACGRHQLSMTLQTLLFLKLLTGYLIYSPTTTNLPDNNNSSSRLVFFGDPVEAVQNVTEGLYYHPQNPFIQHVVDAWPVEKRTYSKDLGATPWMPTGDSRTGLPFILNKNLPRPAYRRVWLETHDQEYIALDIALPTTTNNNNGQHDTSKPLYLVLHGLNGGSQEEYVKEFTSRRTAEGSTVVVMIARGLMDLPIKGWNIFHGARVDDVHSAALALQKVTAPNQQTLAAVGFSMGAIILGNYVARIGNDCPLDAAIAISGGLDMRFEHHFVRAQRLWQPMLAQELRDTFLVNKWGERVRARISLEDMKQAMRAAHITEIDQHAVATYNRFDNVTHYYMEMSAMGDIPMDAYQEEATLPEYARIHNVAIPFCVIHSLDDPLVTWRTVAANTGLMHPTTLTSQVKSGNLLVLLTKAGGHVGWPLGWLPIVRKWQWMNDAASTFVEAVHKVSQQHTNNRQCVNSGDDDGTCRNPDAEEITETNEAETGSAEIVEEASSDTRGQELHTDTEANEIDKPSEEESEVPEDERSADGDTAPSTTEENEDNVAHEEG